MSIYVKLVCEALTDAKLLAAGPVGFSIWARGLLYAKQHLTDGFVPDAALPLVAFGVADPQPEIAKLVTLKLWEPCDGGNRVPGNTWAKYQTTAADIEAKREKNRANGKKGAESRWQKNGESLSENGESPSKNSQSPQPRNDQSTEHRAQSTDSKAQSQTTEHSAAAAADVDPALREWIEWWNSLVDSRLVLGRGNPDEPNGATIKGWARFGKDKGLRALLSDRNSVRRQIEASPFVQRKGWFTLPKLFGGRNATGEAIAEKLMGGLFQDGATSNGRASPADPRGNMGRLNSFLDGLEDDDGEGE